MTTKTQTSSVRARLGFGNGFGPNTAVARARASPHRLPASLDPLHRQAGERRSRDRTGGCAMTDLRQLIAKIAYGKVHPP
jgi:hypothetical protein